MRVEGHADNAPNWGCTIEELARRRAQNVSKFLTSRGIDADRLVAVGFGDTLPRADNRTREGRAQNRRVEFHILQHETVQGLRQLLMKSQRRGQIDDATFKQLERTATGAVVGLSLPIRHAAADLLAKLSCDWSVQRLLYIAARKEGPQQCAFARLPEDCVRRVLRLYFLLGCSYYSRDR